MWSKDVKGGCSHSMIEKFFNLDKEKQDRILNAAIKEFAQKGYDNASTNEIVKEAGISKGLLFHYFKNKKQLYLFLKDHFMDLLSREFYQKDTFTDPDIFVRIEQSARIKMELRNKYPDIFKFVTNVYLEDSKEVKEELDKWKLEMNTVNINKAFEGIDTSLFREDVDPSKVIKIIMWTAEQFAQEETAKAKLSPEHDFDYEKVLKELNEYFTIFKNCFYKIGGL
jgi:AcrR family transcriptional regulator